jgi:hypothetical protein
MCYNFKTSVFSYSLGVASAVFAFCTRQFVLGSLILAYAQMQLSEAMIWYGIDKNDTDWNKTGSKYGKYLLATHNFAIGIGIILSIIFISKQKLKLTDFIPMLVGVLIFIFIVCYYYFPQTYPDVTFPRRETCNKCQDPENRLQWKWPHQWYFMSYVVSIIIMAFYVKPMNSKILFLIFFTLTLVVTFLIYPNTMGSVWCWSTSFMAPCIVLIKLQIIYYLHKI